MGVDAGVGGVWDGHRRAELEERARQLRAEIDRASGRMLFSGHGGRQRMSDGDADRILDSIDAKRAALHDIERSMSALDRPRGLMRADDGWR